MRAYLRSVGLPEPDGVPLRLNWADKRIAVYHGHEPGFRQAPQALEVDYILHGHTHTQSDHRVGSVRVINPGALHRAAPCTVATLDLRSDALTVHEIR